MSILQINKSEKAITNIVSGVKYHFLLVCQYATYITDFKNYYIYCLIPYSLCHIILNLIPKLFFMC